MTNYQKEIFKHLKASIENLSGEKVLNLGSGGFRIFGISVDFRNPPLPQIRTFSLGQKVRAYYGKSAYYESAQYNLLV